MGMEENVAGNRLKFVTEVTSQIRKQNISAHAASTAFFLFLSMVPMLIVLCTIIPYTPLTEENLVVVLTDLTPEIIDPVITGLISEVYDKSAGVLSLAVIITIWSAAKGVMALMNGLNDINDVEEKRNYFLVRMVASFYTVIMLIVMILSLVLMVFGNRLVALLLYRVPQLQAFVSFMMNFRFIFVWFVLTILFGMIYTYIPNIKLKFKEQLLGAMFSAIVWSVFSWGFSIYVDWQRSSSIYGSLSIIVFVMLWMYFCMYIILIGAHLNRYFGSEQNENSDGGIKDKKVLTF